MPSARPLFTATLLVSLAPAASAMPALRYSWEACDPVVADKAWSGPAIYTQTLSAAGLTAPLHGFAVSIGLGHSLTSAWSFTSGGCQGEARFTALTSGGGCASVPGLGVSAFIYSGLTDFRWHLFVQGDVGPAFSPDAGTRYTLAVLRFDHSRSAKGPQDPAVACGDAEQGRCFAIEGAALYEPGIGYTIPLFLETSFVTWQDPANATDCPRSTPARNQTWGRIKAIYR